MKTDLELGSALPSSPFGLRGEVEEISTLQTLGVGAGLLPGNVPALQTAHTILLIPVTIKWDFIRLKCKYFKLH